MLRCCIFWDILACKNAFLWHCFTHFSKTTAPQEVIFEGKLSTIIFKRCKFSVNLRTLCFVLQKYPNPLSKDVNSKVFFVKKIIWKIKSLTQKGTSLFVQKLSRWIHRRKIYLNKMEKGKQKPVNNATMCLLQRQHP